MDPICEEKYNFLQKYVPFLANLIELLANDKEKQDKLAQMQLLYNLLNKPDNSVKIETLEKCEEVLCRVFGNTDEKLEVEDWIMPSPLIKAELPEEPDECSEEQDQEESLENINGSLEHQCDDEATTTQSTSLPNDDSRIQDETNSSTEEKLNNFEPEQVVGSEDEPSKQPNFLEDESQEDNSQESINPKSSPIKEGHAETSPKEESQTAGTKNELEDEMKDDAIPEVSDSRKNKDETENESTPSIEAKTTDEILEENGVPASNQEDSDEKEVQRDLESNYPIDVSVTNDLPEANDLAEEKDPAEAYDLAKANDLAKENDPAGEDDPADAKDPPKSSDPSKANDPSEADDSGDAKDPPESSHPSKANDSAEPKDPPKSSDPSEAGDLAKVNDLAEAKDLPEANQTLEEDKEVKPDKEETEKTKEETSETNKPPDKIEAVESQQFEDKKESSVCKPDNVLPSDTENAPKDVKSSDKKEAPLVDSVATASKVEDKDTALPALEVLPAEAEKSDNIDEASKKTDDQKESQNKSQTVDELTEGQEQTEDVIRQSQTEMLTFKIVSAESLAPIELLSTDTKNDENLLDSSSSSNIQSNDTAKETSTTTTNETNKDLLDPLDDPLDPSSNKTQESPLKPTKSLENGSTSPKDTQKDEDDDDVLLVETRSSPICIDSDPEDEENMKGNRSMPVSVTKTPINRHKSLLQKPKVRKSTSAVMETIRHIISKNQNIAVKKKFSMQNRPSAFRETGFVKKDPKALMETIDLLDSDSEDERPKNNFKKAKTKPTTDDDVIIVSSSQPQQQRQLQHRPPQRKMLTKKTARPVLPPVRFPPRLTNKSPQKPATAQSNFLNAVNLQPAPKSNSSSNPASFSAQLSNKKVIIPNAFYGNPSYNRKSTSSSSTSATAPSKPSNANQDEAKSNDAVPPTPPPRTVGVYSGVSIRHVQDKVLKEWLEGFLTNFASPLQIASHACFVLLQRVLKYRFFQRLKETRIFLNTMAKSCSSETVDVQMLLDLRNVFLENDYLTEAGRRFCRFATNDAFGKPVALTTDAKTGRVTCRTRVATKGDLPTNIANTPNNSFTKNTKPTNTSDKPAVSTVQSPASVASNSKPINNTTKNTPSPMSNASTPSSVPRRRGKFRKLSDGLIVAEKDEDDNDYTPTTNEIEPEAEIVTERKRSLRTNRTKRKEAGFTYSEDHDDEEFEALARKIENKKREEQRLADEREEMERELLEQQRKAIKKTVAKKTTSKRQGPQPDNTKGPTRKKLRLANASIVGSEDNDLLTPTWIEADGDDAEVDSLLDFADEPQSPEIEINPVFENDNTQTEHSEIEETSQDTPESFDVHTDKSLKNIDRKLHLHCPAHDFCVHCQRRVPRIVHHYVNEHRSSEVFPARLRNRDVRRLLTTSNVGFVHLYKGNQIQYAAHCIFCDKEAKFLLPYWFEHFTMHTGEYSFKCSGCHILKPTRSLLTNHLQSNSGCPKKGKAAIRLVNFDTKVHQIEAHICSICNYTQLHRKNMLRHLRTQHAIYTISPNHIIKVVLLQISAPHRDQDAVANDASQLSMLQPSDDEDNGIKDEPLDENSLMMQNQFTDNDDLSFMICGMLDVQTNLSPGGEYSGNVVDTTNIVDNK